MSEFTKESLNQMQRSMLQVIEGGIEYSKQIRSIVSPHKHDMRSITDYSRIGITVPQRCGVSVFSQFLCDHLLELFPEAHILRLAQNELAYGDTIDPFIDFMKVDSPAEYGRARQKIRQSAKEYSFIIVDGADWICGSDNRFEKLAQDMYRSTCKEQFIITLST